MTAPIASGWSGCQVGLAPTGKRRLCTAHTLSGLGAVQLKLPAIGARACSRNLTLEPGFQRHSHFFGAHESPADIYIF
jgi:hypothetical protein